MQSRIRLTYGLRKDNILRNCKVVCSYVHAFVYGECRLVLLSKGSYFCVACLHQMRKVLYCCVVRYAVQTIVYTFESFTKSGLKSDRSQSVRKWLQTREVFEII